MPGGGEPEIIGEQGCELYPKQAALCEHTAMLFQAVAEIGLQSVIHDDQCFPEESAVFGTADVESVAQLGQVLRRDIISRRGQRTGQPRAVQIEV